MWCTMYKVAIIGGTGLANLELEFVDEKHILTPYGNTSAPLIRGLFCGVPIVFLNRHGLKHSIPPHKINYRANIWALWHIGISQIIAVAAVGGIREDMTTGIITYPNQVIDYTWGRECTFFEDTVEHIDLTEPYCQELRSKLIKISKSLNISICESCTYAATQGPRLETTAEINKLEKDGCDVVGMTGMPELSLAREIGIRYATCAIVSNRAAGRNSGQLISMDTIKENLKESFISVKRILRNYVNNYMCT